ncbi:D-serine deaminase-like pyridoxal phosphate-dependent protein [Kribbella sp. VKM Ac-2527]|uniref:D-serine deaminase-like pyridoxal phosphate-dependent protein n=1 Tax=Kribbella caucasensis TaxID=2512215 RepID=A0A4R6KAH2_9ACTN|nr:amino acid deaminase/aldolase [Kribbella sp. VKM Ac-2527]TDO46296.1 D-serine deaminase-like pyridoxal phosphate-dependent protein [Kribbella sp. VKM Ac-2527]
MGDFDRYERLTAELDPPFAVVDLAAFRRNAADLVRRAAGTPIRVASKSVRCRALIAEALERPGFHGVMAYSLPEALWLARNGVDDILMGYPTVHRAALRELARDADAAARITLMVDDVEHLAYVKRAAGGGERIRVCLDVDASLRVFGQHLGVRRSPLRTPAQVVELARTVVADDAFELVGVMFYEAQIAGLPDTSPAVRWVKRRSAAELAERRGAVVDAVKQVAPLRLVNSGGTGSVEISSADRAVTEVTAGSGLYGPTLFDKYDIFQPEHAVAYALGVVRRPTARIATTFGGGYVASGPAKKSRLPLPSWPLGLKLLGTEGAGEVQTPVQGENARGLKIGDRVWMRYAKAGEMLERFDRLYAIDGDLGGGVGKVSGTELTELLSYRGEGKNFG